MAKGAGVRVAFSAVLIELVIIAAFGNQRFSHFLATHPREDTFRWWFGQALNGHAWRWDGPADQRMYMAIGVGITLVLLAIFAAAVGRSTTVTRPWSAVFFGVWGSVLVAGAIGSAAAGVLIDAAGFDAANLSPMVQFPEHPSSLLVAFISATPGLWHGFWIGWLPALIAATLASAKGRTVRRDAHLAEIFTTPPPPPQGYFGMPVASAEAVTSSASLSNPHFASTPEQLPPVEQNAHASDDAFRHNAADPPTSAIEAPAEQQPKPRGDNET